jgi:hypothetical protein
VARINRRDLLKAGSGAALAGALLGQGVAHAQPPRPVPGLLEEWLREYDIKVAADAVETVRERASGAAIATGPFYMTGAVYENGNIGSDGALKSGSVQRGTYRSYGWIYDGRTGAGIATHYVDIVGVGTITGIGGIGGGAASLVGGTGQFKSAQGQAIVTGINVGQGAWHVQFQLKPSTWHH